MRANGSSLISAFIVAIASVAPATAQGIPELIRAGRYDDAAARLAIAAPDTAEMGGEMLFDHVYQSEFQQGDWESAIRGFVAGKTIPRLNERQRQRFDFWHAVAIVNTVRGEGGEPPDLTREETLARLQEAYDLLVASRDYAVGINQASMAITVARMIDQASQTR
jgi:hypothetical protein